MNERNVSYLRTKVNCVTHPLSWGEGGGEVTSPNPSLQVVLYNTTSDPTPVYPYVTYSLPNGVSTHTFINTTSKDSMAVWVYNYYHNVSLPTRFFEVDNITLTHNTWVDTLVCEVDSADLAAGGTYRYGFNKMERDDEVKGMGNSIDFGARMYDSRLGRWMSLDMYANKYPNQSPYNGMLNSPIRYVDADGNVVVVYDDKGTPVASIDKSGMTVYSGQQNNAFLKAYLDTKAYIQMNNNSSIYTDMESRAEIMILVPLSADFISNEVRDKGPQFIPLTATQGLVLWDPHLGLETETGNNSPAGVLTHEVGHAESFFDDPGKHIQATQNTFKPLELSGALEGMKVPDTRAVYTNQEEMETIATTNSIMKNLKFENSKRNTHDGKLFKAECTTCPFPLLEPEIPQKDNLILKESQGNGGF